jgi:hypothetical protein
MQKKKLHHNQEQTDDSGQTGVQQILQVLQKTHDAQGNQITKQRILTLIGRNAFNERL